jgi:hypothetical protein
MGTKRRNVLLYWDRANTSWPAIEKLLARTSVVGETAIPIDELFDAESIASITAAFVIVRSGDYFGAVAECKFDESDGHLNLIVTSHLVLGEEPVPVRMTLSRLSHGDRTAEIGKSAMEDIAARWRQRRDTSADHSAGALKEPTAPPIDVVITMTSALKWAENVGVHLDFAGPARASEFASDLDAFAQECVDAFGAEAWRPLTSAAWGVLNAASGEDGKAMLTSIVAGLNRAGWGDADIYTPLLQSSWFERDIDFLEVHGVDDSIRAFADACARSDRSAAAIALTRVEACLSGTCRCERPAEGE